VDAVMDAAKVLRGEMKAEELEFKLPAGQSALGSTLPRPTALGKVTGTLDYGADLGMKLPDNALHLALVQAEVSHANIKGIDASEALKMPGVHSVLTHKDVKGKNRITGLITFPTNKGDGWDRPILCDEKVFQYGDAIAIVCADSEANARAAAAKVKVDLEVLPAYMSAPAAMAEDAIEIHPGTPNVYYRNPAGEGRGNRADLQRPEHGHRGGRLLPAAPAAHAHRAGRRLCLHGRRRQAVIHSKSIGVHLHLYMIAPGLGLEPDQLALVARPHGRHLRLQVQPDHGSPGGRGRPGHRPPGLSCATTTNSSSSTPASARRSGST
jgi:aldehyde oxidoreductase